MYACSTAIVKRHSNLGCLKRETLNWIPYEAVENSVKTALWRQSDLGLLCLLKKIQSSVLYLKKILGSLCYTVLCVYMYWQMQTAIL